MDMLKFDDERLTLAEAMSRANAHAARINSDTEGDSLDDPVSGQMEVSEVGN